MSVVRSLWFLIQRASFTKKRVFSECLFMLNPWGESSPVSDKLDDSAFDMFETKSRQKRPDLGYIA